MNKGVAYLLVISLRRNRNSLNVLNKDYGCEMGSMKLLKSIEEYRIRSLMKARQAKKEKMRIVNMLLKLLMKQLKD